MSELVLDPNYWKQRLEQAQKGDLHHAVFRCPKDRWLRIEEKHRQILDRYIDPDDAILDAGCGWGRLLSLMPDDWKGGYLGIDISPDFIALAETLHPDRSFFVGDLRQLPSGLKVDVAILISIRPMVKRELGNEVWNKMERELRRCAKVILYLEYDENDEGSLE